MSSITVPTAAYFLGCDVSKLKLDMSLVDGNGVELWTDRVANNDVAIAEFLLALKGNYPDEQLCCVVESTGIYHQAFARRAMRSVCRAKYITPSLPKVELKALFEARKLTRLMHSLLPVWGYVVRADCIRQNHISPLSIMLGVARS